MVISDIEIEVVKKNIKNIHLYVLPPDGKVRISAPLSASDEAVRSFASSKMSWVKKHIKKYENQPKQSELKYETGETFYLWGQRYMLELIYGKKNRISIDENKIILNIRGVLTVKEKETIMNEWYRVKLKNKLPELIEKWEDIIGVKACEVRIKNMTTRWGTCNVRDKRVWFNLQLATKPVDCLEYVVVHELVHLIEKTHSNVFYSYMDKFLPDWKSLKSELNGNTKIE